MSKSVESERNDSALLSELQSQDGRISSVYDLVNGRVQATDAILRVLVAHLDLMHSPVVMEGVVRSLTSRHAPEDTFAGLYRLFVAPSTPELLRWAIGNAMSVLATPDNAEDLMRLLANNEFGIARQMVAVAIGRVGRSHPKALDALLAALGSKDIGGHVVTALGLLRDKRAVTALRSMDTTALPVWAQRERSKTLRKLARLQRS